MSQLKGGLVSHSRKKPKLSDLSRTPPTRDEYNTLASTLEGQLRPIEAAVLGACLVEHALDTELVRKFKWDEEAWAELTSEIGPFRDFHSKIMMGRIAKLYGDDFRSNLTIIKSIRNQFAHAKKIIDFDNHLVVAELKKAKPIRGETPLFDHYVTRNTPQYAYISLCMLLAVSLIKREVKATKAYATRKKRELEYLREFMSLLAASTDGGKLPAISIPRGALLTQRMDSEHRAGGAKPVGRWSD